jgi:ribonuclease R
MNPEVIKKQIIQLVSQSKKPLPISEISRALNLKKTARKRLQRWLGELVIDGQLFQSGRGSFSLGKEEELFAGSLDIMRSGDAMMTIADSDKKVRIDKGDLNTAMQGDKVLARYKSMVQRGRDEIQYAKVIRIIERVAHDIVGTLKTTGRMTYVVPMDRRYRTDFYVASTADAVEGDRVVVRFVSWEDPKLIPEGEIMDVIGPETDASLDTLAVIKQLKLRDEFSDEALKDAEHVSGFMDEPGKRRDIRDALVVTIDPDRAKDFDDALSLEDLGQGIQRIGIHIADVAHFVREGSALDLEARERGNSVYFPDKVVPMLPEQLSNGLCSLRPDQDRLAFSAFLDIDSKGIVLKRDFSRTIIRSKRRLTYGDALKMLRSSGDKVTKEDKEVWKLLRSLGSVAQKLRKRRYAAGAMEMDIPEAEFDIGKDGMITGVRTVSTDESHQLVEEFMIAANEAVATKLCECGATGIHRIHEPPFEERIEDLTAALDNIGFRPGNLKTQKGLAVFLKSVEGHPLAHYARIAVLKSMNRAMYSTNSKIGHYGLAKRFYLHFTSPIRRYPDLVAHRELAKVLAGKTGSKAGGDGAKLGEIAKHCTATEKIADQAERDVTEIKKYRFLEAELAAGKPLTREAVIVNVMKFGVFVELLDLQVQGLVHISVLAKGYSKYDSRRGEVKAGKKVFKVGGKLNVVVSRVDFEHRKVDFVPV